MIGRLGMDGLRLIRGVAPPGAAVGVDVRGHHSQPSAKVSAGAPRDAAGGIAVEAAAVPSRQSYLFPRQLRRLWPGGGGGGALEAGRVEVIAEEKMGGGEEEEEEAAAVVERRRGNWVLNILPLQSLSAEEGDGGGGLEMSEEVVAGGDPAVAAMEEGDRCVGCGGGDGSEGCVVGEGDEEPVVFDRESFSSLLRRLSVAEVELYTKLSYLGNLAYTIPKIEPKNLLKFHGLRFVTSSLEKKGKSSSIQMPSQDQESKEVTGEGEENGKQQENGSPISASTAYKIAASAASYLKLRTKGILPFRSTKAERANDSNEQGREDEVEGGLVSSEEASLLATTNSVTAMVAGKEEMKQAVAKNLNSSHSLPCQWFICDDDSSSTRYFVIQGSGSLASWQANLLFEPVQFEGLDVLVHRGIYEAAKGIYQQMLPEIRAHLGSCGNSANLRFTGHSLGGSLALLVNLMLLIRGEAPASSLLPVITFGSPCIMCGGDYLLQKLGLPKGHVQAIILHRDIVPRAFSCNYPDHVAKILKAINGNFRNHPCLKTQKMLYAPMGKLLILQPEEKFSPHHHLLPPGSGLYLLGNSLLDSDDSARLLQAAQCAFLNTPHPLEILSNRSAYGSQGTVYRDHNMTSYLRSFRGVIHQELKLIRKAKRERRRQVWWPLVAAQDLHASIITGQHVGSSTLTEHHFSFAGVLLVGKETLKQFGRLFASRHVQVLVVLLFPARLLLLRTLSIF